MLSQFFSSFYYFPFVCSLPRYSTFFCAVVVVVFALNVLQQHHTKNIHSNTPFLLPSILPCLLQSSSHCCLTFCVYIILHKKKILFYYFYYYLCYCHRVIICVKVYRTHIYRLNHFHAVQTFCMLRHFCLALSRFSIVS